LEKKEGDKKAQEELAHTKLVAEAKAKEVKSPPPFSSSSP
jgi:hypothetical protein